MAAKRQAPMGKKSSKFVVGKQKSVDVWRHQGHQKSLLLQNPYSKGAWQNGRRSAELVTAVFCRRQTKIGTRVENIKATKKVSWCKTHAQKGRGKMAAEVQSWSQQFECLNVLGFQRRLAHLCGLSICPDIFSF